MAENLSLDAFDIQGNLGEGEFGKVLPWTKWVGGEGLFIVGRGCVHMSNRPLVASGILVQVMMVTKKDNQKLYAMKVLTKDNILFRGSTSVNQARRAVFSNRVGSHVACIQSRAMVGMLMCGSYHHRCGRRSRRRMFSRSCPRGRTHTSSPCDTPSRRACIFPLSAPALPPALHRLYALPTRR